LTFDLLFITGDPTVFGNLSPPDEVIDAVVESLRSMRFNGYAPSTGKRKKNIHSFIHSFVLSSNDKMRKKRKTDMGSDFPSSSRLSNGVSRLTF